MSRRRVRSRRKLACRSVRYRPALRKSVSYLGKLVLVPREQPLPSGKCGRAFPQVCEALPFSVADERLLARKLPHRLSPTPKCSSASRLTARRVRLFALDPVRQSPRAPQILTVEPRSRPRRGGRRHASPSMMHDRERNRASASTIIARSAVEPHPFAGLAQ